MRLLTVKRKSDRQHAIIINFNLSSSFFLFSLAEMDERLTFAVLPNIHRQNETIRESQFAL